MSASVNSNERNKIFKSITNFKHFLDKPINDLKETYDFLKSHNMKWSNVELHTLQQKLKNIFILKDVPVFIVNFIKATEGYCNNSILTKQQRFAVVVYLTQYCSSYELFKNASSRRSVGKEAIFEVKRCICKQMRFLLDNASTLLFDTKGDTTVGSFLTLMDLALDRIAEIDVEQGQNSSHALNEVSSVIEEILCLSMSIAQIAFDDDSKIITAGCRSVLGAIENLRIELNQGDLNIAMCNLATDTCSDKLCGFEARVNTAVLRLCLRVFSEYEKPMQTLYDFCVDVKTSDDDALDNLISEFDLHMDRIFQIGLFSIASSTIGKCAVQMKNIMANLELLEGELVPAFAGVMKDSSPHGQTFADILKKSWCTQVKLLRKIVHTIIEPSAYCKLIYEELKQQVEDSWQHTSEKKDDMLSIDLFVSYTKELGQMLKDCMESFECDMQKSIKKQLEVVLKVLHELIAARNLLLHENSKEIHILNQRIFKRCQVLLVSIKRLWMCISGGTQENQLPSNEQILVEDNAKNQNIGNSDTYTENVKTVTPKMDSIMIKSRQLLKDRSICHLNSNGMAFIQSVTESTFKQPFGSNLTRLTRNENLREYSYRQKTFVERNEDINISEHVFSQMKDLKF